MGIRKNISDIIDHIYCAMCGQPLDPSDGLTEFEKEEVENGNLIKLKVICPGCGHETQAVVPKTQYEV